MSRIALIVALVSCLTLAGCAAPNIKHEYSMAPGAGHHSGITRALALPINETAKTARGLDSADEAVARLQKEYLESKGITVDQPALRSYRRAFAVASDRVNKQRMSGEAGSTSSAISYGDLVPTLIQELESDAQIVIISNVVMRTGEYIGGKVMRWDGVTRREKVGTGMISGAVPVASIHSIVYDAKGNEVLSGYGGLDAIFETNIAKRRYDLKEDLLQDEGFIRERICISFHPYFGSEEYCRGLR